MAMNEGICYFPTTISVEISDAGDQRKFSVTATQATNDTGGNAAVRSSCNQGGGELHELLFVGTRGMSYQRTKMYLDIEQNAHSFLGTLSGNKHNPFTVRSPISKANGKEPNRKDVPAKH